MSSEHGTSVREGVHERRGTFYWPCWACGEHVEPGAQCAACGAPGWVDVGGAGGVYILASYGGLRKIGLAHHSIIKRVAELERMGGHQGLRIEGALHDADGKVERWLHRVFADDRDSQTARNMGLPCPTEWFWSSTELDLLARNEQFIGHRGPA